MTDLVSQESSTSAPVALKVALESTLRHARSLRHAASACIDNFRWLSATRRKHIVLLDFDVVFGALAQLRLGRQSRPLDIEGYPATQLEVFGEAATRHLLTITPEYCLPPGSTAELLHHRSQMRDALSESATRFLKQVDIARNSSASGAMGTRDREDAYDILQQDATRFADDLRGSEFLDRVLERATPIGDYVDSVAGEIEEPLRILKDSYAFLQRRRPRMEKSNFYDALNAAAVATMLSNPRTAEYVPILVTTTRSVLTFNNKFDFGDLVPEATFKSSPFSLFNDPAFLLIFESLLGRTEQRYFAAADQAEQLMMDAEALAYSVEPLLDFVHRCEIDNKKLATYRDLPKGGWEMLLFRSEILSKRWAPVFAPVQLAAKRDLAEAAAFVRSDRQTRPSLPLNLERDSVIESLMETFSAARSSDDQIWDLLVRSRSSSATSGTERPIAPDIPFELTWTDLGGDMFRSSTLGASRAPPDRSVMMKTHWIEVNVVSAILSAGSVLRIDSLRDLEISPRRYLRISWLHALPVHQAAEACQSALGLLDEFSNVAQPTIAHVFYEDAVKSLVVTDRASSLASLNLEGSHMIELERGFQRSFADLQPLQGVELHLSLSIEEKQVSQRLTEDLAELVESTSAATLPRKIVLGLIEDCFRFLGAEGTSREKTNVEVA